MSSYINKQVTIPNGTTVATVLDCDGNRFSGFITPAALTGTIISMNASLDGVSSFPIKDKTNAAYTITVVASTMYVLPEADIDWKAIRFVHLTINGAGEGALRTIQCLLRPTQS